VRVFVETTGRGNGKHDRGIAKVRPEMDGKQLYVQRIRIIFVFCSPST
jgi:hypothetical protein